MHSVEVAFQSLDFRENSHDAFEGVAHDPSSEKAWRKHQGERVEILVMEGNAADLVKDLEDAVEGLGPVWHQEGHQGDEDFQVDLLLEHRVDSQGGYQLRDQHVDHQVMDLQSDSQELLLDLGADQEVQRWMAHCVNLQVSHHVDPQWVGPQEVHYGDLQVV